MIIFSAKRLFSGFLVHSAAVVGKLEKLIFDINKPQRSKAFPACLFTFTVCIFLSPPNLHPHNLPCVNKKEINRPIYIFSISRSVLLLLLNMCTNTYVFVLRSTILWRSND